MAVKFRLVSVLLLVSQGFLIKGDELSGIEVAEKEGCELGLVDAATRTEDGSSYLFKGDYYWKIEQGGAALGYPRLISDDWPGMGTGIIDAAFTWNDGSTFIFKGDQYWRFVNRNPEDGYPKKISEGFRGIPDNVDAAVVWQNNGLTYFFKGDKYWRYNPKAVIPTRGKYPAELSAWKGVPDNITAAIRWEGGLTYFFKGTDYYQYDNGLQIVPQRYPISTAKAWFKCSNATRRNEIDTFERENPNRKKIEMSQFMSKINELLITVKDVYSQQLRTLFKLDSIKEVKESNVVHERHNDEDAIVKFDLF